MAVLHDGKRRDGVDAEHGGEVRLLVNVDLAELDLVLFRIQLGKHRRHHLARLAPLSPEVNDDETRIVEHLGLEVFLRQRDDLGKGARLDIRLVEAASTAAAATAAGAASGSAACTAAARARAAVAGHQL